MADDLKAIKDALDNGKGQIKDDVECIGLYFSAHWCPPCRGFTPTLAEYYTKNVTTDKKPWEIVFISCDNSEAEFNSYFESMPWKAVKFSEAELREFEFKGSPSRYDIRQAFEGFVDFRGYENEKLGSTFKVQGIPALIVLNKNGKVLTNDGRSLVVKGQDLDTQAKG